MEDNINVPLSASRESASSSRPLPVTLVAMYEFIKAAGLLLIFRGMWSAHKSAAGALGQDALSMDPFLMLMPATALFIAVLGLGLWNLQRWARWLILPASALFAPRWVLPIPDKSTWAMLQEILPRPIALIVVVLDILVVLTLLSPDVRKAFVGDGDSDLPSDIP